MVSDEWVYRAIQAGKTYEQLPTRVRNSLSLVDWKARVKEFCIIRGYGWSDSVASTSCGEQEYYEELVEYYKRHERLFPYHLSHYVIRVLRVTPFKYYNEILFNSFKEEKAYDKIPNFTAADMLRLLGVGRNEYIATLDSCKAKKLLWRVNKGIAKEKLPIEPVSISMEHWWKVAVVNVSEPEFRVLAPDELDLLQSACQGTGLPVRDVNVDHLRSMYKRGLVYLEVRIREDDRFVIPPLEGFVSNRNVAAKGESVDPMESLLYSVFVANSENMTLSNLSRVLNVDIRELKWALGVACRLGFATRLTRESQDKDDAASYESFPLRDEEDESDSVSVRQQEKPSEANLEEGQAVALVVDAETISYLMMGALSPGVKRHAVTLFEGGRVSGNDVIAELISELRTSFASMEHLEGEMVHMTNHAKAVALALECVKEASGDRSIELLRRESLAGLAPGAIQRVLSHGYKIVVPVAPLPGEPLPLGSGETNPVFYGPSAPVASPWFQLALYDALKQGPVSIMFMRGQRVQCLPDAAGHCSAALLRLWEPVSDAPIVVSQPFMLYYLNEMLKRGPVMLQPLHSDVLSEDGKLNASSMVNVPLPLNVEWVDGQAWVTGFFKTSGAQIRVGVSPSLPEALSTIGLDASIGFITMMHVQNLQQSSQDEWLPVEVHLGLPFQPIELCEHVCKTAIQEQLLKDEARKSQTESQLQRWKLVDRLMSSFGGSWGPEKGDGSKPVSLPACNFMFDGSKIVRLDFSECLQGPMGNSVGVVNESAVVV